MTIKEIPQLLLPDNNQVSVYSSRGMDAFNEEIEYGQKLKEIQQRELALGRRILNISGALNSSRDLVQVLKKLYPDAGFVIRQGMYHIGSTTDEPQFFFRPDHNYVELKMAWNKKHDNMNGEDYWRTASVGARTQTQELVFIGNDKRVLSQDVWSTNDGKQIVEECLVNSAKAYGIESY